MSVSIDSIHNRQTWCAVAMMSSIPGDATLSTLARRCLRWLGCASKYCTQSGSWFPFMIRQVPLSNLKWNGMGQVKNYNSWATHRRGFSPFSSSSFWKTMARTWLAVSIDSIHNQQTWCSTVVMMLSIPKDATPSSLTPRRLQSRSSFPFMDRHVFSVFK